MITVENLTKNYGVIYLGFGIGSTQLYSRKITPCPVLYDRIIMWIFIL